MRRSPTQSRTTLARAPALAAAAALALALASALAAPGRAAADDADPGPTATAKLFVRQQGAQVAAAIVVTVKPHWHLYHEILGPEDAVGMPTTVTFTGAPLAGAKVRFPAPKVYEQRGLGTGGGDTWILGHEGAVVLRAEAEAPAGGAVDLAKVRARVEGLTCLDDGSCVPFAIDLEPVTPGPDALFAALAPPGPGAPTSPAEPPPPGEPASKGEAAAPTSSAAVKVDAGTAPSKSLAAWLGLAFLAGMILNVMPCVLPVISIKVLSFVQQAGESRGRVLALGLAFSAGIIAVFVGLAVASIALGTAWGDQFQREGFLVTMIAVVFAFGLSLFGVFEIGVPVPQGSGGYARREGLGDAFSKGMLATALATPCSGPFLGSTLAWTLTQPSAVVLLIFLALGVGMAFPYVILTANPALLRLLPRPGRWMETFKQAMGFLLMATVIYLLFSVRQERLLPVLILLAALGLGCWWWGRFADYAQARSRRLLTLGVAIALAAAGGWLGLGPVARALEPPVVDLPEPEDPSVPIPLAGGWEAYTPRRLEHLRASGRSVFLDFTASWCPNCKWNERFVYDSPEALALFAKKGVVRLKADMTNDSPRTQEAAALRTSLGARSIPFMAVFPKDAPGTAIVRHDIVRKADFLSILEGLPDP